MISAVALGDKGETVYILGLSYENLRQLGHGYPIQVTEKLHGLPPGVEIIIYAGPSEDSILEMVDRVRRAHMGDIQDGKQ